MAKGSNFLNVLRDQMLTPRFDALIANGSDYVAQQFDKISQRMCWYNCVEMYKKQFGTPIIDLTGNILQQYGRFLKAIREFCESSKNVSKAVEVDARYGAYWGLLRKVLNIDAKGRAVLYGASGSDILVTPKKKSLYINDAAIFVLCEKETLGEKFLAEMSRRGWRRHINLIITQGFSTCEVIETIMEIEGNIAKGNTNCYFAILHDMDIAGIGIYLDVKSNNKNVLEFGINFEMLDRIDPNLWNTVKESTVYDKKQITFMQNSNQQKVLDRLGSYRLELDNLYVTNGIGVFADYAEYVIQQNCKVWDLNRLDKPSVPSEPHAITEMESKVKNLWSAICNAAVGVEIYNINWNFMADDQYHIFVKENINFKGGIKEIKNFSDIIEKQDKKLKEIVETDEGNLDKVEKIRTFFNLLNIDKIEEKLENKKDEREQEDSDKSDDSDEEDEDSDESDEDYGPEEDKEEDL